MNAIQVHSHTWIFRIEAILETCRRYISTSNQKSELRILSFGCSVGDEILSLKYFFPDSRIFGCDVKTDILDRCQSSFLEGSGVHFFESNRDNITKNGPYDLIIASAVLCVNPSPKDYAAVFPFSKFDDTLCLLDECLSPGGLLAICNAGYRFSESSLGPRYNTIRSDIVTTGGFVDVFNRDGSLFLKQERSFGQPIYSRHGDHTGTDDEVLADCIFEKGQARSERKVPVMLDISPVPPKLVSYHTMSRRNTDYLLDTGAKDLVVVETKVDLWREADGAPKGYSILSGWSSFSSPGMYYRHQPVWFPARWPAS